MCLRGVVLALVLAISATAARGEIYFSSDGGKTWVERGPKDYVVTRLFPYPGEEGAAWAIATPTAASVPAGTDLRFVSPALLRTVDGGMTWEKNAAYAGTDALCMAIDLRDSNTVWVGGWFSAIQRSTNGGKSWTKVDLGELVAERSSPRQNVSRNVQCLFVRGDIVLAAFEHGGGGHLLRSKDGGKSWLQIWKGPCVTCLEFDGKILVVDDRGHFVSTSDEGKTWTTIHKISRLGHRQCASAIAPDGSECVLTPGGIALYCQPGVDWKEWNLPEKDLGVASVAWSGGLAIALLREGEYIEFDDAPLFRSGKESYLWSRDKAGTWTPLPAIEGKSLISLASAGDACSVWLITK